MGRIHDRINLICLPITLCVLVWITASTAAEADDFELVGYLPDYRIGGYPVEKAKLLDRIIIFSASPTINGGLDTSVIDRHMPAIYAIKTHCKDLSLCVGGWERGKLFHVVAGSPKMRAEFVKATLSYCQTHGFTGVDLDWEFPRTPKEVDDYTKLLAAFHQACRQLNMQLSIAMSAHHTLPTPAFAYVDRVHLMAYDHGGRHATVLRVTQDAQSLINHRVPSEKILLGIPFYARGIKQRNRVKTYAEIVRQHSPDTQTDEVDDMFFNGPATVKRKTDFARRAGLGGMMIWEIGQDVHDGNGLLNVLSNHIRSPGTTLIKRD